MCGIAGWVDFTDNLLGQEALIGAMAEVLSPRGPDADGTFLREHVALGHRRLIVVDPAGGAQPMTRSHNGKDYTIVYNGELYNTLEIRQQLAMRGHRFLSANSDTEVLLIAYIEWGTQCLERLNGIFAFAVWDENEEQLFLARDRLGVKPLFYTQKGSSFLFASELKSLLVHPAVRPVVDAEGLSEIFVMGPARTPGLGVFKGVNEVKPGHYSIFSRKGLRSDRYWRLDSQVHKEDLETTAVHLRELLRDTVYRQLGADVPICTLLSGGLDSSVISAFAAEFLKGNSQTLQTFSVDYVDNSRFFRPNSFETNADYPWVKRVAEHLGTNHIYTFIDNEELAEALLPAMKANDLPGMADIDSSLYLFSRELRKHVVVGLSGECADEILGGYPWFRQAYADNEYFPWIRMAAQRTALLSPSLRGKIDAEEYIRQRFQQALAEVPALDAEEPIAAWKRQLFYLNMTHFMPTLLNRKDRMSMAWGLEVRVPFSDHRLVEYVWNIPWEMKTCDGMAKGILRRAMKGLLPDDVLQRPKSPYPKTHNPLYASAVKQSFLNMINTPSSPILPLIDAAKIRNIAFSEKVFFEKPWFGQLMGDVQYMAYLLQVNWWMQDYRVELSI